MPTGSLPADGLALALGEVVAEFRRDGAREIAVTVAEARAVAAETRAAGLEVLAEVRARVAAFLADLPVPKDGRSPSLEELEGLVRAVAAELVAEMLVDAVADAVGRLPAAKDGAPGAPGMLPICKAWAPGVHYAGEVVTHAGGLWQCWCDTANEPGTEPGVESDAWLCLAAAGRDGVDGRSFCPRGLWSADRLYAELDVVALNGASFVAVCDDPGPCPGDGWRLLAARGKAGKPGEVVRTGEPAPKPGVVGMTIDGEGLLRIVNGDGSTISCDLYPVLVKAGRGHVVG